MLMRAIPSTGEQLPVIGVGTWGEPVFYAKRELRTGERPATMAGLVGAPGTVEWMDEKRC